MTTHGDTDDWEDWENDERIKTPRKPSAPKWDVPGNPKKSSNISELEFLKQLCDTESRDDHCCTYETVEEFRCHCGTLTTQYRCKVCNTVLCGKTCPLLRPTELVVTKGIGEDAPEVGGSDSSTDLEPIVLKKTDPANPDMSQKNSGSVTTQFPFDDKMVNVEIRVEGVKENKSTPAVEIEAETKILRGNTDPAKEIPSQASVPSVQRGFIGRRMITFGRGSRLQGGETPNKIPALPEKQTADVNFVGVAVYNKEELPLASPLEIVRTQMEVPHLETTIPYEKIYALFPQKDLSCYIGKEMKITSVDGTNRMYLIPSEYFESEVENILDEINDVCKDAVPLSPIPSVGQLACVYQKGKAGHILMSRCVILEKFQGQTKVHLLDFGGDLIVSDSNLKPFDVVLEKIALAGFEVLIKDAPAELPKLTSWKLKNSLSFQVKGLTFKLKSAKKSNDYLYEVELVKCSGQELLALINDCALWKWEKLVATKTEVTDDDACHDGAMPVHSLSYRTTDFPPGPIKMQCCNVDPANNMVQFGNMQSQSIIRDNKILQDQIASYVQNVKPSPYCPARDALFIVKRGDVENSQWERASRATIDNVFCVDSGEVLFFKDQRHTIRKVPSEFFDLPLGSVTCKIKSSRIENLEEVMATRLQRGKFYNVELLSWIPDSSSYYISDSCLDVSSNVNKGC